MSEERLNNRRNWKAIAFPYDNFFPDNSPSCQYCLTDKQAELIRGILLPVGWATRWWSDSDADIDPDTVEAFRDDLIRRLMMGCCGDEVPVQYRYTSDGLLQRSEDGGATWQDAAEYDPRQNSPEFPPIVGEDGADKRCIAATGAAILIKQQVGDQLTDDMTRYTLGQLISDWTGTILNSGGNIFQALVTIATNQIFALVIATLRPALTDGVYDTLQCILYCNIADDATVNDAQWSAIRAKILSDITGIAGIFLEHLIYLLGSGGLTNLLRAGGAATGDCSACGCGDGCSTTWLISVPNPGDVLGEITSQNDAVILAQTTNVNGGSGYYIYMDTRDINVCCYLSYTVLTSSSAVALSWSPCGSSSIVTGIFNPGTCAQTLIFNSAAPFSVRITKAECP